ncbi:MAG: aminomethyl-transferring glycine dehydrogenase subunit GcvPA [Caldisericia bacterium]|nr:aminomethyl-transferring glycine dehydrogenase subunit GcvPA [Caldisericia bacterium]
MRFIPTTSSDKKNMMDSIGIENVEELFRSIPSEYLLQEPPGIGEAMSEQDVTQFLSELSKQNVSFDDASCFIGEIAWYHYVPSIVQSVTSMPSFYTAYTPYQPELSQGTLEAIYEFQSYMVHLTKMDASNASMYDGASAAAEAMIMVLAANRKKTALVSSLLHPYLKKVLYTYALPRNINLVEVPSDDGSINHEALQKLVSDDIGCCIVQSPNTFGIIEDLGEISSILKERKISSIAVVLESFSLGLLQPPGEFDFDVVCGEAQSFGMYPQFGGPGLGYMCVTEKYIRKMPGRIIGKTVDVDNQPCYVMTLRAREQDIRRNKATSNICTNNALCALQATVFLSTVGQKGLRDLAKRNFNHAHYAFQELNDVEGITIPYKKPFFNEFLVQFNKPLDYVRDELLQRDMLISKNNFADYFSYLKNSVILSFTEMNSKAEIDLLRDALKEVLK